jgi:AraC-like DNA-binding protein
MSLARAALLARAEDDHCGANLRILEGDVPACAPGRILGHERARLLRPLEMLAAGQPVSTIGLDVGYATVGTFISLFRRVFNETPAACRPAVFPDRNGLAAYPVRTRGDRHWVVTCQV